MTPRPDSQSRQLQAAIRVIAQRKQQIGPVAVTFTVGRISTPTTGATPSAPVNLPAASASQGGGLCDVRPFHATGDN